MKVLHLINRLSISNGAAALLIDLVAYQKSQGLNVDVSVLTHVFPSNEELIEKCNCHLWILGGKNSSLFNPCFLFRLGRLMRNYDIVHIHLFPSLYWAVFAKKFYHLNIKLVATIHSISDHRQEKKWLYPFESFVYRTYDRLVAISQPVADMLNNYIRCGSEQLVVINNGINLERFGVALPIQRESLGIDLKSILVVQVARFMYEKDQKTLLRALTLLPEYFQVLFVGDGPLLEEHQSYAESLGLKLRVRFLGSRKDVPSILKAADIVVMSSNFEGFGLVAIEGMAAGKPVVASDVPGLANVVSGAGLLFPSHDEHVLASILYQLSEDSVLYKKIVARCLKRAEEYSVSRMAERYKALYENLL